MFDSFDQDPKKRFDFLNDINKQVSGKIQKLENNMIEFENELIIFQEQHKYLEKLEDLRFLKINSSEKKLK